MITKDMITRKCRFCNKRYQRLNTAQFYCSVYCREKNWLKALRNRTEKKRKDKKKRIRNRICFYKWRIENPEKADKAYFRYMLTKNSNLKKEDIPDELIETKKIHIQLIREKNKITRGYIYCKKCKDRKPLKEFPIARYKCYCKDCSNAFSREWRKNNSDYNKTYYLNNKSRMEKHVAAATLNISDSYVKGLVQKELKIKRCFVPNSLVIEKRKFIIDRRNRLEREGKSWKRSKP